MRPYVWRLIDEVEQLSEVIINTYSYVSKYVLFDGVLFQHSVYKMSMGYGIGGIYLGAEYLFLNFYSMTALLVLKIVIPFLLVCCALRAVETVSGRVEKNRIFLLLLILSDLMGLQFFFLLRDSGSWLQIGTSISHYVISMLTTLVLLLFYWVAKVMTSVRFNFWYRKFNAIAFFWVMTSVRIKFWFLIEIIDVLYFTILNGKFRK